jgi:hypothetical protein
VTVPSPSRWGSCRPGSLWRREDHPGQKAGSSRGFSFVHNLLQMFLYGVFAQIHAVGNFLAREAKHEIDDDHLLPLRQMIALLNVCVRAFESLVEFIDDYQEATVPRQKLVGEAKSTDEQPLVLRETDALSPSV